MEKEKYVNQWLILPAAWFRMYALSAVDNWFEFSRAVQTRLMCCGISSRIPGSQMAGGALTISLATVTLVNDNATKAIMAIVTVWISIVNSFCGNEIYKNKNVLNEILHRTQTSYTNELFIRFKFKHLLWTQNALSASRQKKCRKK